MKMKGDLFKIILINLKYNGTLTQRPSHFAKYIEGIVEMCNLHAENTILATRTCD